MTFELVFDLRRTAGSLLQTRRTHFSFNAGGVTHAGLAVPGWPRLQVGDTVTALLRRPGDWHTLVGWVNHDTGEVAAPSGERTLRRAGALALAVGVFALVLWVVLALDTGGGGLGRDPRIWPWLPWAGYAVFVLVLGVAVLLRRHWHRRTARELAACLTAVRDSMLPPREQQSGDASTHP